MAPTPSRSRELMEAGTALFQAALDGVSDDRLAEPTHLPGWTGRHVVAHVAANADALRNLVHWARTGQERAMYASVEQRNADIEAGALRPAGELRQAAAASSAGLAADLAALTDQQWRHEVRTAQGRPVPATEIPWMRAREMMVHAVDLGGPVGYPDLPRDFLLAVLDDAVGKRSAAADGPALVLAPTDADRRWSVTGAADAGPATTVCGPLAQLAAYATGRPAHGLSTADAEGAPVPHLPRWL